MALAERLGRTYESLTGSRAPLDLVSGTGRGHRTTAPPAARQRPPRKNPRKRRRREISTAPWRVSRKRRRSTGRSGTTVGSGGVGFARRRALGARDMDAVLASYEKALAARRAIEDRILEGRTLNGLGSANFQKGRYETAADFYRQAVDLRRRTGDVGGSAHRLPISATLTYRRKARRSARRVRRSSGDPR